MNILTVTTLFPNHNDPKHGIFVLTRLRHLKKRFPDITVTVIAPVPWFPFSSKVFGEYSKYAGVPDVEVIEGITVYHPRYVVIPKLGMQITPKLLAGSIKSSIRKLLKTQSFDVIDGHYFFPDGVALAEAANEFGIPFTCTARGTDINLIPQNPAAKEKILKVFAKASHLMAVCHALKEEMCKLGAEQDSVTVLRNGVDLERFKASNYDQQQNKKIEKGIKQKLVLSIGWLIERKGHYLIIEAIKDLPDVTLAIAGDGPDRRALESLAAKYAVTDRVMFLGALPQQQLNDWLQAADASVLASSREGWANVLLESMASGTPVVATRVWGTPEVVASDEVGVLVERTVPSIAAGLKELLQRDIDRQAVRQYAERFDWDSTSDGQYEIFNRIVKR